VNVAAGGVKTLTSSMEYLAKQSTKEMPKEQESREPEMIAVEDPVGNGTDKPP